MLKEETLLNEACIKFLQVNLDEMIVGFIGETAKVSGENFDESWAVHQIY